MPDARHLDQASAVSLAIALRACLHLHQQMGILRYPLNKELQDVVRPRHEGRRPAPPLRPARAASASVQPSVQPSGPVSKTAASAQPVSDRLATIRHDVMECRGCALASTRCAQVTGQGNIDSSILIVGDYCRAIPDGADELLFGGNEDELLWKMMQAIGLGPGDVYVTNVIKCRPPREQIPDVGSEQACLGYLHREIALVRPRVILAMGMIAARAVLGTDVPVSRLRGRLHHSRFANRSGGQIQVMVSFHPQYLLEQPTMKKAAWQDLQIVQRYLADLAKGKENNRRESIH